MSFTIMHGKTQPLLRDCTGLEMTIPPKIQPQAPRPAFAPHFPHCTPASLVIFDFAVVQGCRLKAKGKLKIK